VAERDPQEKVDAIGRRRGGDGAKSLYDLIQKQRGEIEKALPRHLDVDRMIRIAWSTIRTGGKLLECSPMSIITGIMEAAQLGLELGGVLGQAYLVPYRNKHTGGQEAQMQIGYRGMILLAHRGGEVVGVAAEVVHANDEFDFCDGSEPYLKHRRSLKDRGEPIAAWAAYSTRSGGRPWRVLGLDDIERARKSSRGANRSDSPWETAWDEMARKTAVRSLLKYAPLSAEAMEPIVRDEYRDAGIDAGTALSMPRAAELPAATSAAETIDDVIETTGQAVPAGEPEPAEVKR